MDLLDVLGSNVFWLALFAGCLLFCWQLPHRPYFRVKFPVWMVTHLMFAQFWPEVLDRFPNPGTLLVCSQYLIPFLLTIGFVRLCYECDLIGATFCAMCGYCLQHIVSRTNTVLWMLLGSRNDVLFHLSYLAILLAAYTAANQLFKRRVGGVVNVIQIDAPVQVIISAVALFAMNIVDMEQFLYLPPSERLMTQVSGPIQGIIFSLVVVILEYRLLSHKNTETERDALKEIVQEKRSQTEFERQAIERVNLTAHDLKHKVKHDQLLPDAQQEIIHAVDQFDSTLHTGNPSLDIILSRKKQECLQRDIQFICIADGSCLRFLGESDLFTLMGNILDNAIEAVERLEDPDMRIIHLTITRRNCFVRIRAENCYQGELAYSGQALATTKEDKEHHGYGLKSISLLVEKHGGSLKIHTEEEMFVLDILFPVSEEGESGS